MSSDKGRLVFLAKGDVVVIKGGEKSIYLYAMDYLCSLWERGPARPSSRASRRLVRHTTRRSRVLPAHTTRPRRRLVRLVSGLRTRQARPRTRQAPHMIRPRTRQVLHMIRPRTRPTRLAGQHKTRLDRQLTAASKPEVMPRDQLRTMPRQARSRPRVFCSKLETNFRKLLRLQRRSWASTRSKCSEAEQDV